MLNTSDAKCTVRAKYTPGHQMLDGLVLTYYNQRRGCSQKMFPRSRPGTAFLGRGTQAGDYAATQKH